jgi:hypothetical protein
MMNLTSGIRFALVCAAAILMQSCSREPMPAVKNAFSNAGHTQYYPWQARNLNRKKVVSFEARTFPKGFSDAPLVMGDQAFLLGTNRNVVASFAYDSVAWVFDGGAQLGDTLPLAALAADSLGNVYAATRQHLYSLTSTGSLRWNIVLRDTLKVGATAPVPLLMASLVVVTRDSDIVAVRTGNGAVAWTVRSTGLIAGHAGMDDGMIAVGITSGTFGREDSVMIIDVSGGIKARMAVTGMRITKGPIVSAGTVLVAGTREGAEGRRGAVAVIVNGKVERMIDCDILPTGLAADRSGAFIVWGPVLRSEIVESRMIQYEGDGREEWRSTIEALFSPAIAVTPDYRYVTVAVYGGRALYQFTRNGKIDEREQVSGLPGSPVVDPLGRVLVADASGASLNFLESDIIGKFR